MLDLLACLQAKVRWSKAGGHPGGLPRWAKVGRAQWELRVNDFPDEPLYTLFVDGVAVGHFDDWPRAWDRRLISAGERGIMEAIMGEPRMETYYVIRVRYGVDGACAVAPAREIPELSDTLAGLLEDQGKVPHPKRWVAGWLLLCRLRGL